MLVVLGSGRPSRRELREGIPADALDLDGERVLVRVRVLFVVVFLV